MKTDSKLSQKETKATEKQPEKPYGFDGKLLMNNGSIQEFHYVGSERRARLSAMMRTGARQVQQIEPLTKEVWIRAYGDPTSRM